MHWKRCLNKVWYLNYELDRPLPEGNNEGVIRIMKDEFGGKIIK